MMGERSVAFMLAIFVLCSKCVAVNITRMEVPALVEAEAEPIVLDCEYETGPKLTEDELVIKWLFNGSSGLIYQWIPKRKPQVLGLLKGKVDTNFRITDDPLQAYRAIKIVKPSTDLSGNYTCVVSTYKGEDRRTKPMLVYSPGKNFIFAKERLYKFVVRLVCAADSLFPKPIITILNNEGMPLSQVHHKVEMNSWGLYQARSEVLVHDNDASKPWEEFMCSISLPSTNYSDTKTIVYFPSQRAFTIPQEMSNPQEHQSNNCWRLTWSITIVSISLCVVKK